MGLETGTGIGDLVPTNPLSTDAVSSGDDHIRLIKTVMQSITFLKSIKTYTVTTGWTRPANVKKILIYCLGGGGGGGGGTAGAYSGGGGSSGAIALKWLDVSAIPTGTAGIGTGGNAGAIGAAGTNGTATGFHDGTSYVCLAAGGLAGAGPESGGYPAPRASSTGDIIFTGGQGAWGVHAAAGFTTWGGVGGGLGGSATGRNAEPSSGGGGAGGETGAAPSAGYSGGSGYCIIFEYGW